MTNTTNTKILERAVVVLAMTPVALHERLANAPLTTLAVRVRDGEGIPHDVAAYRCEPERACPVHAAARWIVHGIALDRNPRPVRYRVEETSLLGLLAV